MPSKVQLYVAQLPQLLPKDWATGDTLAIVIDTLRFTSTACVALSAGARSISVAAEVDAARQMGNLLGQDTLLCGERHCHRIDGFQLGNSPLEYTTERVKDRDLVFSTTNGTLAVAAAAGAQQILLASLLNRSAVVERIQQLQFEKVWILCAGTDGQIAAEDVLTAGAIAGLCIEKNDHAALANDSARIAYNFFHSLSSTAILSQTPLSSMLVKLLSGAAGGRNLIQAGYTEDIAAVAHIDSLSVVPCSVTDSALRFTC